MYDGWGAQTLYDGNQKICNALQLTMYKFNLNVTEFVCAILYLTFSKLQRLKFFIEAKMKQQHLARIIYKRRISGK